VSQEVVRGDGPGRRSDIEPGQVLGDRRVEIEPARLVLLEDRDGRERLADGADLEEVLGTDRLAGGEVCMTVDDHSERTVTAREADRDPRRLDGRQMAFDEPVDVGDGVRRLPHGGLSEEELQLALGGLGRVAPVHQVLRDDQAEVAADRPRRSERGVGGPHERAEDGDGSLALHPGHDH